MDKLRLYKEHRREMFNEQDQPEEEVYFIKEEVVFDYDKFMKSMEEQREKVGDSIVKILEKAISEAVGPVGNARIELYLKG